MNTSQQSMGFTVQHFPARVFAFAAGIAALLATAVAPAAASPSEPRLGCPLRFDQPTTGLARTCLFVGRFNTPGSTDMLAAFAGDGSTFVVAVARPGGMPLLYLPASTTSATAGKLVRWRDGIQPAAVVSPSALSDQVTGSVTLEDGGHRLRLRADGADNDEPAEFIGHFVDLVDAGVDAPVVSQR